MTEPVHHRLPVSQLLVPRKSVAALPRLAAFLPEIAGIARQARPRPDTQAIAGWGHKPTARKARDLAARTGLPYIALEDGFLRSVGLGEAGAPPLSLVADDLGIYYDARSPSRLEALIEQGDKLTPELIARARKAMARIVDAGLSKTNAAPPLPEGTLPRSDKRRVLVVDQTFGDASIEGGLATPGSFAAMVAAARRDEPEAEIIVRRHPAVAAGLKRGCIPDAALASATLLDSEARAADILARVDAVYCVSSLMGFEALVRGLPVRCFGMPFYAGWGATRDEVACDRRSARRDTAEIFAAACLLYSRYVDPISGRAATLEATIERLAEWRRVADASAGHFAATGFTPWKRAAVRNAVSGPRTTMAFHGSVRSAGREATARQGRILIWAGKETEGVRHDLARLDLPVWRMEDGFLRSRGLGSDFHLPASIVLDDVGIYFDRHRPSRLETLLESADFPAQLTARAAGLRENLVSLGLTKYNIGAAPAFETPANRELVLVVGQVEDDRSIERGTSDIATNRALLEAARADFPDAFLVYKPHPDVESGNRTGAVPQGELDRLADHVAREANIDACLLACDTLATMTSLAGFEALLRGKRVVTYGEPFYAGWGLTEDRLNCERRTRKLTLDELVAGALILYPRYIHPPTGLPCRVEEIVDWLASDAPPPGHKRWRWARALWASLMRTPPAKY